MTAAPSPVDVRRDGAVATVVLNRPEKRNALDLAMRGAIADAFRALERDDAVRAIVVTGGPSVFAAGADLNLLVDKDAAQVAALDLGGYWAPVAGSTRVTVAAVSGYALGAGCELAMMCDWIVADDTARFGQPELGVGILPGAGGTQRLLRAVGRPTAALMLYAGETLDAARAHGLGLVADLVASAPPATSSGGEADNAPHPALRRAQELARRAARMPPLAVAACKQVLRDGAGLPLDAALSLEHAAFLRLFDTADKTEGMRAFLEKRKPVFAGR